MKTINFTKKALKINAPPLEMHKKEILCKKLFNKSDVFTIFCNFAV